MGELLYAICDSDGKTAFLFSFRQHILMYSISIYKIQRVRSAHMSAMEMSLASSSIRES